MVIKEKDIKEKATIILWPFLVKNNNSPPYYPVTLISAREL